MTLGPDDSWDLISTPTQGVVKTHGEDRCAGQPCCVHHPSEHHMREWPLVFRLDRDALGERICPCGIGHPDPDSLAYMATGMSADDAAFLGVHGCCGHCSESEA